MIREVTGEENDEVCRRIVNVCEWNYLCTNMCMPLKKSDIERDDAESMCVYGYFNVHICVCMIIYPEKLRVLLGRRLVKKRMRCAEAFYTCVCMIASV